MELANNGNLEEYLTANFESLEWPAKIKLAEGIAQGLKYLHDKQICHRDLVSNHILIKGDKDF